VRLEYLTNKKKIKVNSLYKNEEYGGHWRQGCEKLFNEELINQSTSLYYETTAFNLGPQLPSTPQRTCRYFEASKKIFPQVEVGPLKYNV
jgi:hypothetical protein